MRPPHDRGGVVERVRELGFAPNGDDPVERGLSDEFEPFWEEMTSVRRSAPAGAQW